MAKSDKQLLHIKATGRPIPDLSSFTQRYSASFSNTQRSLFTILGTTLGITVL